MTTVSRVLALAVPCLPLLLGAQAPEMGALFGVVRAREGGATLAHAIVSIDVLGVERMADGRGRFRLDSLPPGRYQLRIRSLGFAPSDTALVVTGVEADSVVVHLVPLAHPLAKVRVLPDDWCDTPGRPGADDPAFAAIFEQMEQNAERLRLCDATYPYATWIERKLGTRLRDGRHVIDRTDTLVDRSDVSWKYRPGTVITRRRVRERNERVIALPTLTVVADPEFQRTHCFAFGGVEELEGRRVLRVDYSVTKKMRTPDLNGSVFLDSATYQIVATRTRLSRIPAELRSLRAIDAWVWFREVSPGLPIADRVESVNTLRHAWGRDDVVARTETQRHLMITFRDRAP